MNLRPSGKEGHRMPQFPAKTQVCIRPEVAVKSSWAVLPSWYISILTVHIMQIVDNVETLTFCASFACVTTKREGDTPFLHAECRNLGDGRRRSAMHLCALASTTLSTSDAMKRSSAPLHPQVFLSVRMSDSSDPPSGWQWKEGYRWVPKQSCPSQSPSFLCCIPSFSFNPYVLCIFITGRYYVKHVFRPFFFEDKLLLLLLTLLSRTDLSVLYFRLHVLSPQVFYTVVMFCYFPCGWISLLCIVHL